MRPILPLAFCAFALMIGNAAMATVNRLMAAEQVEICHRLPEATPDICGELPR